jgi:ankyrin repeat protein
MTIRPDGTLRAAHNRPDSSVQGKFKEMMKEWKIPFELFAPMTREEMEVKRKRIEASKKIIDPNLTIEVAEKSLEDGADPNSRSGLPLKNAVKANNKELVQLLLKKGAMPNITDQNSSDTAISNAEDLEMIKILVNAGASLNSSVFRKVSDDPEAVKYLLEAGMDPSFDRSFPFRQAAKSGNVESMDLLLKYADNIPDEKMSIAEKQLMMITERRNMALKWSAEHGKAESTIFILQKLFELGYKDLVGKPEYLKSLIDYVQNTDASKPEEKQNVIDAIREWSKDKFTEAKESKRFNNFKTFKY